jgi:hypothetical protein
MAGDVLRVQLVSELSELADYQVQLLDEQGAPMAGGVETFGSQRGSLYVLDILVSGLAVGRYALRVQLRSTSSAYAIMQSEPFCVVEDMGEESVLVEVSSSGSAFGVYFDTLSQPFTFRFEGGFYPKSLSLESNDTIFEGQQADFTMLYSLPYEAQRLLLGGKRGIPDGLAQKMNRAFSCDRLTLNGVPYGKTEGAKFEAQEAENYPFRSWAISVKEKGEPFAYSSAEGEEVVATLTWGGFVCDKMAGTLTWGGFVCDRVNGTLTWGDFVCDIKPETLTWGDFVCDAYEADWSELLAHDGTPALTSGGAPILAFSKADAGELTLSKTAVALPKAGTPPDTVDIKTTSNWTIE